MAEDYQAIIDAGQNLGAPIILTDGGSYAVIPEGSKIEDLERFLGRPIRARAAVAAKTAETFAAYVKRFQDGGATVIFADQEEFALLGVIDYHEPSTAADPALPGFREHRISYTAPRSLEWKTWRDANGKQMTQADFARFIEDNVVDIRSPAGAEVLEVSRGLQAKSSVEFASAIRLSDGSQQFTYSETIEGATSKGTMRVPEEFTLGIPVFFGGQAYSVVARLRYRIKDGKLVLWYDLYRPEYIEKDAFEAVVADVGEKTGIEIWHGVP